MFVVKNNKLFLVLGLLAFIATDIAAMRPLGKVPTFETLIARKRIAQGLKKNEIDHLSVFVSLSRSYFDIVKIYSKGISIIHKLLVSLIAPAATVNCLTPSFTGNTIIGSIIWGNVYMSGNSNSFPIVQECGEVEKKQMDIVGITDITVSNRGYLIIEQCKERPEILTIVADKNIMPYAKQTKYGDALTLELNNDASIPSEASVKYHVVVKDLKKIFLSGNTTAETKDTINTDTLAIEVSGASIMNASITVNDLQATIKGYGRVRLKGIASNQTVNVAGASKHRASQLRSKKINAIMGDAAIAQVHGTENIFYEASGASELDCYGSAAIEGLKSYDAKVRMII